MADHARPLGAALAGALLALTAATSRAEAAASAPCNASALAVTDAGTKIAGDRAVTRIEVINNGRAACTVSGYPQLQFRRLSGADAFVVLERTAADANYHTAGPAKLTLRSLGRASFFLGYPRFDAGRNACGAISTITISGFAGKGTISLPDTIAPCDTVNVSPYFTSR